MQRLRLAARLVNAFPSLMALLQSDAGRAWKADLFCDIELLRQEQGPQLVEVESLSDFEKLWCDFPQAWKLLVSSCQRKLVERRQQSEPPLLAPVPILPTFSCDECDAVYFTLRALRSHQMKAHQRRREARRYGCVPFARQIFGRDRGSFNTLRWERNDAFWHGRQVRWCLFRTTLWQPLIDWIASTGDGANGKDEVILPSRQC